MLRAYFGDGTMADVGERVNFGDGMARIEERDDPVDLVLSELFHGERREKGWGL